FDRLVPGSPAAHNVGRPDAVGNYQPPPPPPPPPPPDEPPPPEPLLEPGAVEAEATLLASEAPTVPAKRAGLVHALLEPEYQPSVCPFCRPGSAAAAASTSANLSAQRFSTPSAIAWGKKRSNSSGVFSGGCIASRRSSSVIERYCSNPAMRSIPDRKSVV